LISLGCTPKHAYLSPVFRVRDSPKKWQDNVDTEIKFLKDHFVEVEIINFGGGIKYGRMPDEDSAEIEDLGWYATKRLEEFHISERRKLHMEIEPGTYVMAEAGLLVLKIIDMKSTGKEGFDFLVCDGGMEVNSRPLYYGSRHPFYMVSAGGDLLSSETHDLSDFEEYVPVGICCESGDSQSLDEKGNIVPRKMATPSLGDYLVVGGAGAYCSSMSPINYNSHTQAAEVLINRNNRLKSIRKRQTLSQIIKNEKRFLGL
jgi:diaminopimelate decarboxylase